MAISLTTETPRQGLVLIKTMANCRDRGRFIYNGEPLSQVAADLERSLGGPRTPGDRRLASSGSATVSVTPARLPTDAATTPREPGGTEDGARFSAKWRGEVRSGILATAEVSLRYVGESRLGVGPLLDFRQGNNLTVDAATRLDLGKIGLSLGIANLTDVHGNSFAFGNPFGLSQGNQITPLRPRSMRLGLTFRF
jgi:hypothetical protein